MATNTYVALDKVTVSGTSTTSVTFTSISGTYTDLHLVINSQNQNSTYQPYIQFNSDTGTSTTNYSTTSMRGDGSAAGTGRHSNQIGWYPAPGPGVGTTGYFQPWIIDIMDYTNTTTFKSGLSRFNNSSSITAGNSHLWRSKSAITSITITAESGAGYIVPGSTFSLYGIKASTNSESSPKATGGFVSEDSSYYYHAFPYSGTFTPSESLTADVLVVAGGGSALVGGGGAGGLRAISGVSCTATAYTITVGAGGVSSTGYPYYYSANGGNSSALGYSATGGGGSGLTDNNPGYGYAGGSGGGGAGDGARTNAGGSGNAGSYTPIEGYSGGGSISTSAPYVGGGGGGAGSIGETAPAYNIPGKGGIGATSTLITAMGRATGLGEVSPKDTNVYFAGGGAGGTADSVAGSPYKVSGGLGGGGSTASSTTQNGGNGMSATGGGGGGRYGNGGVASIGGKGGSGVVIIRYAK